MQNRRQHKRYQVDVIEINGKIVLAKYVKILDISIAGVCLKTEKRLNIGGEYTLKMEGKGNVLTVRGTVTWVSLSESTVDSHGDIIPVYKAGMKFVDVSNEKINEILNFIEDHKRDIDKLVDLYGPSGRRLYVRICIEEPEKAVLNYHGSYKVKILSLGGMLIESEHPLEIESKLPMEIKTLTENSYIKFLGRVASCLLIKNKDIEHYDIGIEFIEMSENDREILVELIRVLDTVIGL
jgi:c-di-GMP-binding flagellar brake protein YcgR